MKRILFTLLILGASILIYGQNIKFITGRNVTNKGSDVGLDSISAAITRNLNANGNTGLVMIIGNDTSYVFQKGGVLYFRDGTTGYKSLADLAAGGGGGYWSQTGSYIYPATITDSVGVGTATPSKLFNVTGDSKFDNNVSIGIDSTLLKLHIAGESTLDAGIITDLYDNSGAGSNFLFRKARGSIASPSAITNNTKLGLIKFQGYDGNDLSLAAHTSVQIIAQATQNFTSTNHGSELLFYTTPNTASASTSLAFTIENDQSVLFESSADIRNGGEVSIYDSGNNDRHLIWDDGDTAQYYTDNPLKIESNDGNIKLKGVVNFNDDFTFPNADGSNGQILKTNGSGVVTWGDVGAGQVGFDTLNLKSPDTQDTTQILVSNDSTKWTNENPFVMYNEGDVTFYRKNKLYWHNYEPSGCDGYNLFIGEEAGNQTMSGSGVQASYNIGLGYRAGYSLTSGSFNILMGYGAGDALTSGDRNFALGYDALAQATTGGNNVCIGRSSGFGGNQDKVVLIGSDAGRGNINNNSVGIGYQVFYSGTALSSVGIGYQAGYFNQGDYNVLLGYRSGFNSLGNYGDYNIFIGYQSGYYEDNDNRLYIESSAANSYNALIYGEFDTDFLRINGEFAISELDEISDPDSMLVVDNDTVKKAPITPLDELTGQIANETTGLDNIFTDTLVQDGLATIKWAATLNDDESYDLPDAKNCFGRVTTGANYIDFVVESDGTVTLVTSNGSTDNADTDTVTICLFDNGTGARLRNRSGSGLTFLVEICYEY